jgi:hypothetical protein
MAQVQTLAANPFALMMNPEDVLQAIESSGRLDQLQRRVCRPLDRPLIPKKGAGAELDAFDREVDLEPEAEADAALEPAADPDPQA